MVPGLLEEDYTLKSPANYLPSHPPQHLARDLLLQDQLLQEQLLQPLQELVFQVAPQQEALGVV